MLCYFTSFSTVYLSYQDDGRLKRKAARNGTSFTAEKISPQVGLEPETEKSEAQRLTYVATGASKLYMYCNIDIAVA